MSRKACEELARRIGVPVDDVVEYWSERAGIREHDGGASREHAERAAFEETRQAFDVAVVIASEPRRARDPHHRRRSRTTSRRRASATMYVVAIVQLKRVAGELEAQWPRPRSRSETSVAPKTMPRGRRPDPRRTTAALAEEW